MTEPVAIERLLLPGERVQWEGRPRERPLGPVVRDFALFSTFIACFVVGVLQPIDVVAVATRFVTSPATPEVILEKALATIGGLYFVFIGVHALRWLLRHVAGCRATSRVRYVVTTMRALSVGVGVENERLVKLAELAPAQAVVRSSDNVRLVGSDGAVLVSFDRLEDPPSAAEAIERAIAAHRT